MKTLITMGFVFKMLLQTTLNQTHAGLMNCRYQRFYYAAVN